jgi:hypothetical protein
MPRMQWNSSLSSWRRIQYGGRNSIWSNILCKAGQGCLGIAVTEPTTNGKRIHEWIDGEAPNKVYGLLLGARWAHFEWIPHSETSSLEVRSMERQRFFYTTKRDDLVKKNRFKKKNT